MNGPEKNRWLELRVTLASARSVSASRVKCAPSAAWRVRSMVPRAPLMRQVQQHAPLSCRPRLPALAQQCRQLRLAAPHQVAVDHAGGDDDLAALEIERVSRAQIDAAADAPFDVIGRRGLVDAD